MPLHTDKRAEIEDALRQAAGRLKPGEELSLRAVMAETGFSWYLVRECAIGLGLWSRSASWKTKKRRGLSIEFTLYRKVVKIARRRGISPEDFAEQAIRKALAKYDEADRFNQRRHARSRQKRRDAGNADAAS